MPNLKLSIALLATFCVSSVVYAAEQKSDAVEYVPAVHLTAKQVTQVEDNHRILMENQKLIDKVLSHLSVSYYTPTIPPYRALGANSILAVVDQTHYAALAKKLDAPFPKVAMPEHASGVECNYHLHRYNNELLRSIAAKLSLSVPAAPAQTKDAIQGANVLLNQSHEILVKIAEKLGVKG